MYDCFFTTLTLFDWIDLNVSSLFYNPSLKAWAYPQADKISNWLQYSIFAFVLALLSYHSFKTLIRTRSFNILQHYKLELSITLSYLAGPIVLTRLIMKPFFARCRPEDIMDFGGASAFSSAWSFGNCASDCSFISGHSSTAFALFSIGLAYRFLSNNLAAHCWNIIAVFAGMLMGSLRIVSGKHFLSDIVFAGVIIYFVCIMCFYFVWFCSAKNIQKL